MIYDWDKRMHEMILEMKGVQLEGLDEEKKQRREREYQPERIKPAPQVSPNPQQLPRAI